MKRLFVLLLFSALASAGFAQVNPVSTPVSPDPAREATGLLVTKYNLNADQAKQMYGIQQRKLRNLAQIEGLKTSNQPLYEEKLRSIHQGTLASIRRILRTEDQVKLYQQTQVDVRTEQAAKRKEMMMQSAPEAEIQTAMLSIYSE